MAIVKNSFRAAGPDCDLSPGSRSAGGSSDDDSGAKLTIGASPSASPTDGSDADSGMGSDVYELSEVGEAGAEFCQVGNQTCSIPLDLYNLPDLTSVLSLDTWNNLLAENERLSLAEYLPDMDQETFVLTLTELLSGANLHFGSPLHDLQAKLKGGHCEPRVVLNRKASLVLQKRRHYHRLRKYHDNMVGSLFRIHNAWRGCEGYSMEEKLRVLKTLKSPSKQQSLVVMKREGGFRGEAQSGSHEFNQLSVNKKLKLGRQALPPSKPLIDGLPHGSGVTTKDNPKGILKVVRSKGPLKKSPVASADHYPLPGKHGLDINNRPPGPPLNDRVPRYDDDDYCDLNEEYVQGDPTPRSDVKKTSLSKSVKKQDFLRQYTKKETERLSELQHSLVKNRELEEAVTIASLGPSPRNVKNSYKELLRPVKDRAHQAQADWSAGRQALHMSIALEEAIPINDQVELENRNIPGRRLKAGAKNKFTSDSTSDYNKLVLPQTGDSSIDYNHGIKSSDKRYRGKYGRTDVKHNEYSRGSSLLAQSEDTQSDSSDNAEDLRGLRHVVRKSGFPGSTVEGCHFGAGKSFHDPSKDIKIVNKDSALHSSYGGEEMGAHEPDVGSYSLKVRKKDKTSEPDYSLEKNFSKKGQINNKLKHPAVKTHFPEKKRKRTNILDRSSPQSNYTHELCSDPVDEEADFRGESLPADSQLKIAALGSRMQADATYYPEHAQYPKANVPLSACSSLTKKRRTKLEEIYLDDADESAYFQSSPLKPVDNSSSPVKRKGKSNIERETGSMTAGTPDQVMSEKATAETDTETKTQKKQFITISPTVHTGFSFSIIHLLSAVRKSLVTPAVENAMGIASHLKKDYRRVKEEWEDEKKGIQVVSYMNALNSRENMDANMSTHAEEKHLTPLTVQEIVNYVRSNPGDPRILETQEPLQDLVRGVLKIFSSKTAPLGAKGWKAIVSYDKANKTWYWVGPVSYSLEIDIFEEEISSEAWGIPHKMLVKLVDAYANWLKNGQETLQQIGSLPAPPIMAPVLDERERFKDLRAQKSLNTINPSSDEVREYFRKEERLRYSIPDRAFHYTAADGKKSIVAPLRRGGGKPTSKARDHFMLKPDRPPHVTILCLVRDAAARLPGSIGTRADACTLIRDSQYIVEDVSDAQVNQVVSGALDRLHYERDPCVQYDSDRKLWVYLHRDRDEEDFEDDGTSSTKKWKRQRKEPMDSSDTGVYDMNAAGDPTPGGSSVGYDFNPDSNVDTGEKPEILYNDIRSQLDSVQSFIDPASNNRSLGNPDRWGILGVNSLHENIFCQENSINEDFDDESYSRDRPVGLFGALL